MRATSHDSATVVDEEFVPLPGLLMRSGLRASLCRGILLLSTHSVFKSRPITLDGFGRTELPTPVNAVVANTLANPVHFIICHVIVTVRPLSKQHRVFLTV